jgi:hypothetical protein
MDANHTRFDHKQQSYDTPYLSCCLLVAWQCCYFYNINSFSIEQIDGTLYNALLEIFVSTRNFCTERVVRDLTIDNKVMTLPAQVVLSMTW